MFLITTHNFNLSTNHGKFCLTNQLGINDAIIISVLVSRALKYRHTHARARVLLFWHCFARQKDDFFCLLLLLLLLLTATTTHHLYGTTAVAAAFGLDSKLPHSLTASSLPSFLPLTPISFFSICFFPQNNYLKMVLVLFKLYNKVIKSRNIIDHRLKDGDNKRGLIGRKGQL